jgi:hypothetical protein
MGSGRDGNQGQQSNRQEQGEKYDVPAGWCHELTYFTNI